MSQCTAKSKRSGRRCRRAAIMGGTVCSMHSGKAPQVVRLARERLNELAEPAVAALLKTLEMKYAKWASGSQSRGDGGKRKL